MWVLTSPVVALLSTDDVQSVTGVSVSAAAVADFQQFSMKTNRGTVTVDGKEAPAKV